MKKNLLISLCFCIVTISYGQNKTIFTDENFSEISKDHRVLAIIPFEARLMVHPTNRKKVGDLKTKEQEVSLGVQSALYDNFRKQIDKEKIDIDVQTIAKTNTLLAENGIDANDIEKYTPKQLAKILNVDGIVSGVFQSSQPNSNLDAAVFGAMDISWGFFTPTNVGDITVNITDGKTGKLLWSYYKHISRLLGSNTESVVAAITDKAAKKLPYQGADAEK